MDEKDKYEVQAQEFSKLQRKIEKVMNGFSNSPKLGNLQRTDVVLLDVVHPVTEIAESMEKLKSRAPVDRRTVRNSVIPFVEECKYETQNQVHAADENPYKTLPMMHQLLIRKSDDLLKMVDNVETIDSTRKWDRVRESINETKRVLQYSIGEIDLNKIRRGLMACEKVVMGQTEDIISADALRAFGDELSSGR